MADEYLGQVDMPAEGGQPLPQTGEPVADATETKPITRADIAAELRAFEDKMLRAIQSQTDKSKSQIKKEVEAKLASVEATFKELKEAGYAVTDEDLRLARTQALRETMTASREQDNAAQQSSAPAHDAETVRKTNDAMRQLQKRYGYVLQENDPEFWEVPFQNSTPEDFIAKYEAGLKDVVTRLGRPLPQAEAPGNLAARMPPPAGMPVGGLDSMTDELTKLQNKTNPTPADIKRRKELALEIGKHIPKK